MHARARACVCLCLSSGVEILGLYSALMAAYYPTVWINHTWFICSSADGHLACWHVFAAATAAKNVVGQYLFQLAFSFSSGCNPRSGACWIIFRFLRNLQMFSVGAALMHIPTTSAGGSLFSTPSPKLVICRLFDDAHSGWCEVLPYCSFDFHFSNN